MRRIAFWMGALLLGVVLTAAPAQAGFVAGGTSHPGNSSVNGFVDVQVYTLSGGSYGVTGASAALDAALTAAGGGKKFLYLYETTNNPGSPDVAQNTVQTVSALISGAGVIPGWSFTAHPGGTPATVDAAGTGLATGGPVAIALDGAAVAPSVGSTPSSVTATFSGGLTTHSSLWGYFSDQPPIVVNTSIQDGGNSAAAGTYGVPEPSSVILLASGAVGMVSYRLKRRKA
jgi:hypothetical protein